VLINNDGDDNDDDGNNNNNNQILSVRVILMHASRHDVIN
jgi:hypothetical protein